MNRNHTAVDITKEASDTSFIDCKIGGTVKNAGKRSRFIRTEISLFKKEHPLVYYLTIIASIIAIIDFILNHIKI